MPPKRRTPLPYDLIAGVEPCPGGWLVVSGRLIGTTMTLQEPEVLARFVDVLDYKPAFTVIAVHAPIGLIEKPQAGGRTCEREARRLLGHPRGGAIGSAPSRLAVAEPPLEAPSSARGFLEILELEEDELLIEPAAGPEALNPIARRLLPKVREVAEELQPYWQRTVYEVHPELSFFQLNGDMPVRYAKHTAAGRDERSQLLENRLPYMGTVMNTPVAGASTYHLLDATADLWTARRIMARAVARLPKDPEWDEQGLRMEIVR
jgi:predicted RNase H-like nuclease